jgi:hypothetical protein
MTMDEKDQSEQPKTAEDRAESVRNDLFAGFDEWWNKRGYANDCPSDRHLAEDAWKAARGMKYYPCIKCGAWRTREEGGTMFTVCDECCDTR